MVPSVATLLVALAAVMAGSRPASAADQLVRGRKSYMLEMPSSEGILRRSISMLAINGSKENDTSPMVGDPLLDGLNVTVIANGATSTSQTFSVPAGARVEPDGPGWTRRASPSGRRVSCHYVDERKVAGPVHTLRIQQSPVSFRISVAIEGGDADVHVAPPTGGTDGGGILAVPGGSSYCFGFGGPAGGFVRNHRSTTGRKEFKITRTRSRACPRAR